MKTMGAAKFKATCLAVMDDVRASGQPVLVTKNGKPVAKVVPVVAVDDPLAIFRFGGFKVVGDIESPSSEMAEWKSLP